MTAYVPDASDIVWLELDPQAGHEQAGHRLVGAQGAKEGRAPAAVLADVRAKLKALLVL